MGRLPPPSEPPILIHVKRDPLLHIQFEEEEETRSRADIERMRKAWANLTVRRLPGEDIYTSIPMVEIPTINVVRCQWCRQPLPNMVARCQVCGGHA